MSAGSLTPIRVRTNAGLEMPRLIYGTAWKKEATTPLVVSAVLAGFRGIDTACQPKHYFEPGVGEALRILAKDHGIGREELFIQTKFTSLNGQDPKSVPYDKNADLPVQVQQSMEKSLLNLGVSYVDSLVMHSPMRTLPATIQVWKEFEKFVQAGKVKQLGLSNCYDLDVLKGVYDKASVKPSVLQNRFYEDSDYDKDIRKFCAAKGILYQSFWTLTANGHHLRSMAILGAAQKRGITPAEVWFRYLVQKHNIVVLTGTKDETHMRQDLNILNWKLDENEIREMDKLI